VVNQFKIFIDDIQNIEEKTGFAESASNLDNPASKSSSSFHFILLSILSELHVFLSRLHDVAERRQIQGFSLLDAEIEFITVFFFFYNYFNFILLI
jgi:hypothetical protein